MLLELGKFVSLLLGILCLCALFHAALLMPDSSFHERIIQSLEMLSLANGVCWASGWIFHAWEKKAGMPTSGIHATLPVKMLLWAEGWILLLFLVSWFLESYYLPLRAAFHG